MMNKRLNNTPVEEPEDDDLDFYDLEDVTYVS